MTGRQEQSRRQFEKVPKPAAVGRRQGCARGRVEEAEVKAQRLIEQAQADPRRLAGNCVHMRRRRRNA